MKIKKILNNNAVIVHDGDQEMIAIGAGVAFNKGKNDVVAVDKIEKLFVLKENEKLEQLLQRIPDEHFILSEDIISYAEKQLGIVFNDHISIALTDHLSFAIERVNQGIHLKNKLTQEIKILYREEFEIGLWALKHVKEKIDVKLPVDEAAFIALHIHTMKIQGGDIKETVKQTVIIRDMVDTIEEYLHITLNEEDVAYERLITHLRFALTRSHHYEVYTMDDEMHEMIKKKFPLSYSCAQELRNKLFSSYHINLPEEELGYITLHIERLRTYSK